MKRIYKNYSYGKELVGYDYKGYYIDIEEEVYGIWGQRKKWYKVKLKNGEKCMSDTLKYLKIKIDNELSEVK